MKESYVEKDLLATFGNLLKDLDYKESEIVFLIYFERHKDDLWINAIYATNFIFLGVVEIKFSVSVGPLKLALVKTAVAMVKPLTSVEHVGLLLIKVGIAIARWFG